MRTGSSWNQLSEPAVKIWTSEKRMDRGFSTTLIHRGEGRAEPAGSPTTPIYETTTFVFDSADEVRRYNEGKAAHYLYSRYENPTVVAAEEKLAAAGDGGGAPRFRRGSGA